MSVPERAANPIVRRVHRDARCRVSAILLMLATAAACSSDPTPMAAPAGSTITIPVSSDALQQQEIGHGSELLAAVGRYDLQRGELRFHFAAGGGSASSFTVSPRMITRAGPDPASPAAFAAIAEFNITGRFQVLALVDLPATAQPGSYVIQIQRCRRTRPAGPCTALSPDLPYSRPFTVLPGTGAPNPSTGTLWGAVYDTQDRMRDLYPFPKVIFRYDQSSSTPPATHAVIGYPADKITIKSVFEEQYGGSRSLVSWADDPAYGRVRVDLVDPSRRMFSFAIAFDLKDPPPGVDVERLSLNEIVILSSASYDLAGVPIAAQLVKIAIH